MTCQHTRRGLTLLEVVIVFTIIGTLFALLLPAIQKVRSFGMRVDCAGNLRKIGAAAIQYHDSHGLLPPGYLGPKPNGPAHTNGLQWVGCLVYLLPNLDGSDVYQRLVTNRDPNVPPPPQQAWWVTQDLVAAQTKIAVFHCPADPNLYDRLSFGVTLLQHPWDNTLTTYYLPPEQSDGVKGRTNYSGVAGAFGKDAINPDPNTCPADFPSGGADLSKYEGLFTNRSVNSLRRVPDGTSNTLLFGEGIGGSVLPGEPRDWAWTWMGIGSVCTKFGLGQAGFEYGNSLPGASWPNFSSRHPDGVNFCFADGSVRMIRFGRTYIRKPSCSQDWYLLQALAGYRDGEIPGP